MKCLSCGTTNPDTNTYCGQCGNVVTLSDSTFEAKDKRKISAHLGEDFRVDKIIQTELTQAVLEKMIAWLKLFGFFIGIPIALIALILAGFGIKTIADVTSLANRAEVIRNQGDSLTNRYNGLRVQLAAASKVASEVQDLQKKVEILESTVGIDSTNASTPSMRRQLEATFTSYLYHLDRIGIDVPRVKVRVELQEGLRNAYYNQDSSVIYIDSSMAGDPQVALYTYSQHLMTAGLTNTKNLEPEALALISGLADYLACSFTDTPLVGPRAAKVYRKPYLRNLENNLSFLVPMSDPITRGAVWGGAFWELRKTIGKDAADKLLLTAWGTTRTKLNGSDLPKTFAEDLLDIAAHMQGATENDAIRSIFRRRGVSL